MSVFVAAATVIVAIPVSADPSQVWVRSVPNVVRESSPVAVDLDGGGLDVLVGAHDGKVYALHGSDGSNVPGWPQQTTNAINSSPSVADTDGDGKPEIFVGSGIDSASGGALYSFEDNGATRFRFQASDTDFASPGIHATPALGDVNSNGIADATFGALGVRSIWSIGQNGAANSGFPVDSDDTVFSSPALADVNGDGATDFIIGSDSSPGGTVDHRGGIVRAVSGGGRVLWEFRINEIVRSSPSVGDIDGDGRADVVFGAGNFWVSQPGGATDSTKVFALDLDGRLKPGWPKDTGAYTLASPTLADFDGNGRLDVAIGTWEGGSPGRVFVWDGAGNIFPGFPKTPAGGIILGSISTADLNGDGAQDLLVPTGGGIYAYSGRNGAPLFQLAEGQASFQNSPLVTDVDADGLLDIIAAGGKPDGSGVVYRFELPAGDQGQMGNLAWPMFRKDARRTGSWTNPPLVQSLCPATGGGGYWLVARDGGIFAFCDARFFGSTGAIRLNQPIVGMTSTPTGNGYWLVASDGGIFAFGDARFFGSTGAIKLNQPIVGMTSTPTGNGYWLVASDGGIFAFGDARFFGSTGAIKLNQPIVGMTRTASGNGYWLVASDGGIFAFGDARFFGSTGAIKLNQPIVGMTRTASGNGYWLVASDGGIFAFGDARFFGSTGAIKLNQPIVGMYRTPVGNGYWLVASDGGIFAFGDARFFGSTGAIRLNQPIVGMAVPSL